MSPSRNRFRSKNEFFARFFTFFLPYSRRHFRKSSLKNILRRLRQKAPCEHRAKPSPGFYPRTREKLLRAMRDNPSRLLLPHQQTEVRRLKLLTDLTGCTTQRNTTRGPFLSRIPRPPTAKRHPPPFDPPASFSPSCKTKGASASDHPCATPRTLSALKSGRLTAPTGRDASSSHS